MDGEFALEAYSLLSFLLPVARPVVLTGRAFLFVWGGCSLVKRYGTGLVVVL